MPVNQEQLYSVLIAPGGAVVKHFDGFAGWEAHPPQFIDLPRLPVTSAEWVEHEVDSDGHLSRVSKNVTALAVTVSSLAGNVTETGDGTPGNPFVNLNSVRSYFTDCTLRKLRCAGIVLSVTVAGTIDYAATITGGMESAGRIVYDLSQAQFTSSGSLGTDGNTNGGVVIKNWHGDRMSVAQTFRAICNSCTWSAGFPLVNRRMYRANGCTFDECGCSGGKFFESLTGTTIAGGSYTFSGDPAIDPAIGNLSNCVLSGVSASASGFDYEGGSVIQGARTTIFEACSVTAEYAMENPRPSYIYTGAVTSCVSCTFDRCSASVALGSSADLSSACFQACGFAYNSASIFNECSGNRIRTGACSAGLNELQCDL